MEILRLFVPQSTKLHANGPIRTLYIFGCNGDMGVDQVKRFHNLFEGFHFINKVDIYPQYCMDIASHSDNQKAHDTNLILNWNQ